MPWQISFHAKGNQFRPSDIDFAFSKAIDTGTIGKNGYYLNKPIPYGSIVIEVPREIPNAERISYLVKLVQPLIPEIKQAGATEWYLDIARYYSNQCNEDYSSEEMALMASLNCPLYYSAYKVSEEEEKELEKELGGFEAQQSCIKLRD